MRAFVDRNIKYGKNTIKWDKIALRVRKDGEEFEKVLSLSDYLNMEAYDNEQTQLFDYSYIGRSIIKLQSLGVIQTDFTTTLGTSSYNNIDRIHITIVGQEIINYISKAQEMNNTSGE